MQIIRMGGCKQQEPKGKKNIGNNTTKGGLEPISSQSQVTLPTK
jgi:hypothetical protein